MMLPGNSRALASTAVRTLAYTASSLFRGHHRSRVLVVVLFISLTPSVTLISLLEQTVWKPLPFPGSQALAVISRHCVLPEPGESRSITAFSNLEAVAEFAEIEGTLVESGESERVNLTVVSDGFFGVLRSQLLVGSAPEFAPGTAQGAVLSENLWRSRFHQDKQIIGRQLRINGLPLVVTGVVARPYLFPQRAQVWMVRRNRFDGLFRGVSSYQCIARLKSGSAWQAAEAELTAVFVHSPPNLRDRNREKVTLIPLAEFLYGGHRASVLTALVIAGALLLIGLINAAVVAGLDLLDRQRETAVRLCLGAGAGTVFLEIAVRQLVLSAGAAFIGLIFSPLLARIVSFATGVELPEGFWSPLSSWRMWVIVLAASGIAGLAIACAQLTVVNRIPIHKLLQEYTVSSSRSRIAEKLHRAFLAAQLVATATVILVGAKIVVTYWELGRTNLGFRTDQVLTAELEAPSQSYQTSEARLQLFQGVIQELRAHPLIRSVGAINYFPLDPRQSILARVDTVPGRPAEDPPIFAGYRVVHGSYFEALRVPLVAGRFFDDRAEREVSTCRVLINRKLALALGREHGRIGAALQIRMFPGQCEIVGIVGDVRHYGVRKDPRPEFYIPLTRQSSSFMTIAARTVLSTSDYGKLVRKAVHEVDRALDIGPVATAEELVARNLKPERERSLVVSSVAGLALLLSLFGVHGVVAKAVAVRYREIGIRLALGGGRAQVSWRVTGSIVLVALGSSLLANVLAAAVVPRIAQPIGLLPGPGKGLEITISVWFVVVCLAASFLPVWRATGRQPFFLIRRGD